MTIIYKCDRCGTITDIHDLFHGTFFKTKRILKSGYKANAKLDVCGKCFRELFPKAIFYEVNKDDK